MVLSASAILIITIVLVSICILYLLSLILLKNHRIKKKIENIEAKFEDLKNNNVSSDLTKLKTLSKNNKEFADFYNAVNDAYNSLKVCDLADVDEYLNKSKDDIAQNRFKDAAENIRHLEDLVRNYEHQLNTIASKIASFFEREKECRNKAIDVKEKIRNTKAK